jgi:hypothetical protein
MKLANVFSLALVISTGLELQAQDSHYWTQQYGTKSMLLSGSVIGGVEDLGAVYYNPARLSVTSGTAFLLSANVYELNTFKVDNVFGDSKNASTTQFRGVPTLAAGTFKIKKLPKHFFAYAFITRQNSDYNLSYQNEVYADVLASLPGEEYFGAAVNIQSSSSQQWTSVSWSYAFSPKFSVGVTTNYSLNKQSKGNTINLQALSQSNEVELYRYTRNYSYTDNGLLWKIGSSATLKNWLLGLTITTPLISLGGKGSFKFEEFFSPIAGASTFPPTYSTTYQSGLAIKYKSPLSIGFGVTRNIGKNKIHFSTEWFSSISKYTMMSAADKLSQSNPQDTIKFHLVDDERSVLNAGIGAEFFINKKVSGFASFSTDFSSITNDLTRFVERKPEAGDGTWSSDFYHIGGGFVLNLNGADITLGVTHTGANLEIPRPFNFPDNPSQPILNTNDVANTRWDRWRFVFSFSFPFLKNYTKKLAGDKEEEKK